MNNKKLTQVKSIDGMFDCRLDYDINKVNGTFKWLGPKISPEVWKMVLAFFHWTHETTTSESQVRLYVNRDRWAAWAFPQEARTGMTAKELDTENAKEQRALFGDEWSYFGTVHHHCGGSAFQSGTDRDNEIGIDGLHITVGGMGKDRHDIHCRVYISGVEFNPNMSWFYDVSDIVGRMPEEFQHLLTFENLDKLARDRMAVPAPADFEFPNQWRENLIEVRPAPGKSTLPHVYQPQMGYNYKPGIGYVTFHDQKFIEAIGEFCAEHKYTAEEVYHAMAYLAEDEDPESKLAMLMIKLARECFMDQDDQINLVARLAKESERLTDEEEKVHGDPEKVTDPSDPNWGYGMD